MEAFFSRHTRLFSSFALPRRSHAVPAVFFDYGIPPHGVALARFSCCSSSGKEGCREYRKAPPELLRRGFDFDHIKCHRQVWNTWGMRAQDVRKGIRIERKSLKMDKKCRKNIAVVLCLLRHGFCAVGFPSWPKRDSNGNPERKAPKVKNRRWNRETVYE